MTPLEAARKVQAEFPIGGYAHEARATGPMAFVGEKVSSLLAPGASVLDFGSGPGDLSAVLAHLGFDVTACDDLRDDWHLVPGNREKILGFCARSKVKFEVLSEGAPWPWGPGSFDMVMIHHVLEHIHNSPRGLMLSLMDLVKARGYVFVTVPSAVNLRKQVAVVRWRTNMPSFGQMYWSEGTWRGHVREYTRGDLELLAEFLGVEIVALESYHALLHAIPRRWWGVWKAATKVFPGWRDSWSLIGRKRENWSPARSMKKDDPAYARWRQPMWA